MFSEWTEEHDFYLRHRLFLNPLCNSYLFFEDSVEDLEELQIEKKFKDIFNEKIEEFKLCRKFTFECSKHTNEEIKR